MSEVRLVDRVATPSEYRMLCEAVGWTSVMNLDAAPAALAASLCGCVAVVGDEVVGMARLVGDGAIFFYVQDVAVLPSHQGMGVGAQLLRRLLEWLEEHAPDRAFVGVFAAAGTEPFYGREGFEMHAELVGMFRVLGASPGRARPSAS